MMHNPQMMALGRVDHFNMKGSMCVIALFGVVTIISYFNELNKAGLLRRGVVPRPLPHHLVPRRLERSLNRDTIIQKNPDLHQLGLQIVNIKKNTKIFAGHTKRGQEINIKLHLGQNASYEKNNNSVVPIYNHKNTLSNFYTTLNMSLYNISTFNSTRNQRTNVSLISVKFIEARQRKYQKAVMVFAHQHEPHAYMLRDCLKNISHEHGLSINNLPINWSHRKQWDSMSRHKRNSFQVLYGGLTFGVCESISRPCSYFTLVSHPVDRLAAIYDMCSQSPQNGSAPIKQLCRQNNANRKHRTLKEFILAHGSSFFEKLVYYAKNCRLIGEDEICLQGSRTSFVLTAEEADAHLRHILQHLESWFAAVGLIEHFQESLNLFQSIYGYDFNLCHKNLEWMRKMKQVGKTEVKKMVLTKRQRKVLLKDSDIKLALQADMAIYGKMAEIFMRQVKNSKRLTKYLHLTQKAMQDRKLAERREQSKLKSGRHAEKLTKHKDKHKVLVGDSSFHGNNKTSNVKESKGTSKGHSNIKHPKESNCTQIEGTTTGNCSSIARVVFPQLPKHTSKGRKDKAATGGKVKVDGLDQMMYQNLSALELSKSHAEGVRPGTLEKSNAVHLRHLPNPGITSPGKHKHRTNESKVSKKHLKN